MRNTKKTGRKTIQKALLVRLEVKEGLKNEIITFLQKALPMVQQEDDTTAWFAFHFEKNKYGIFGFFTGEQGRKAHVEGQVAIELMKEKEHLLSQPPVMQEIDVLTHTIQGARLSEENTRGLLLTFKVKSGYREKIEQAIAGAGRFIEKDAKAWFAIKLPEDEYGVFGVYPADAGRFRHMIGDVPRQLLQHSFSEAGSIPEMEMLNLIASK